MDSEEVIMLLATWSWDFNIGHIVTIVSGIAATAALVARMQFLQEANKTRIDIQQDELKAMAKLLTEMRVSGSDSSRRRFEDNEEVIKDHEDRLRELERLLPAMSENVQRIANWVDNQPVHRR